MIAAVEEDARCFYERTGWYVSDLVLADDLIEHAIAAAERIYACDHDRVQSWSRSPLISTFDRPFVERDQLRVDQFPSFHNDVIREVVHSREIAALAAELLATDEIRYYKDILIGAPTARPDSSIGWHTDVSYWPTCIPEQMVTVYVPLQERTIDSGTLVMLSGSHRWSSRSFNITAAFEDLPKLVQRFEAAGHEVRVDPLPHRRGQVSFHSSLVVHATYPNITQRFQHSIVFGLQARGNRFAPSRLKRLDPSLVVNLNDEIGPVGRDGQPDLKHDGFYPVLYRSGGR